MFKVPARNWCSLMSGVVHLLSDQFEVLDELYLGHIAGPSRGRIARPAAGCPKPGQLHTLGLFLTCCNFTEPEARPDMGAPSIANVDRLHKVGVGPVKPALKHYAGRNSQEEQARQPAAHACDHSCGIPRAVYCPSLSITLDLKEARLRLRVLPCWLCSDT